MSEENLELVRRAIAAFNDRDLERYLACLTPTIQLRTPLAEVEGVYDGHDGIRRFWSDVADAGPDFRLHLEHLEAVAGDRALASLRTAATGRTSGVHLERATPNVYTFAAGRIDRIEIYLDRHEALQAVGLAE